jgi:branched-chain amino acid transport system substrate-binding protein
MDYPFGWEVVGGFQKGFEQAGGQVIQKIWPPLGFRDFSEYIKSMRKDADAVFLCNVGNAAILVPKQYKQFGPGLPVIGMGTSSDESTLADEGDDALGYVTTLIYSAALQTPANKAFADAYRAKYHKDPSYYAECGYTSGLWINKALDALKGDVSDKEKVLAALKNVELKDAPRGPIKLDAYNSPIENVYVRKVEKVNGKLQNTVIQTFPNVSQFWKWKPEDYLKEPLYSRENPPCKFCTTK